MCEWNKIRTKDRIRICARWRGIIVQIQGAYFLGLQSVYCVHKHRHILKKHFTENFFNSIDVDGNGTLDAGEIKIMLKAWSS